MKFITTPLIDSASRPVLIGVELYVLDEDGQLVKAALPLCEPRSEPTEPRFVYGILAEKVSATLAESGPMSRTRLAEAVGRKGGNGNRQLIAVVDDLIQAGFIDVDTSGKYMVLVSVRPFVYEDERRRESR